MSVRFPMTTATGRNRAHHLKVDGLGERRDSHGAADDDGQALEVLQHPLGRDDGRRGPGPQRREANGDGLSGFDKGHGDVFL